MNQWDQAAATYNKMMGETGDIPHQKLFDPAMRQFLGDFFGKIILDAGCGNGYWARFLALKTKKVVAIDGSKKLLQIAQSKNNPSNITFVLADLNKKLPLESGFFDLIVSNMVLHYVADIKGLAKEFYRVLKKQGRLIFSISHPRYEAQKNKNLKKIKNRQKFSTQTLGGRALLTEYYQPLVGYQETFTKAGFRLLGLKEPLITQALVKEYPRYQKSIGLPRAAIFSFKKFDKIGMIKR